MYCVTARKIPAMMLCLLLILLLSGSAPFHTDPEPLEIPVVQNRDSIEIFDYNVYCNDFNYIKGYQNSETRIKKDIVLRYDIMKQVRVKVIP